MRFSSSPEFLNRMANHPDIFSRVAMAGQSHIDLSEAWSQFIGIECESGGFLFHKINEHLYECHTLFLPGNGVLSCAKEALHMMFCGTYDCERIVTRVPVSNRAANILARRAGLKHSYQIPLGFNGLSGREDCDHFGLTLWDWIISNELLRIVGHDFHERLSEAIGELSHPDDPIHDKFVGYAMSCLLMNNGARGVEVYNSWAAVSGYQPVAYNNGVTTFDNVSIDQYGQIKVA